MQRGLAPKAWNLRTRAAKLSPQYFNESCSRSASYVVTAADWESVPLWPSVTRVLLSFELSMLVISTVDCSAIDVLTSSSRAIRPRPISFRIAYDFVRLKASGGLPCMLASSYSKLRDRSFNISATYLCSMTDCLKSNLC